MLDIKRIDELDENKINITRRKSKKKQIFLFDTQRKYKNYVLKLVHSNNGNYDEIPHFIIDKFGNIYQLFNTDYSSQMFDNNKINKQQIRIAIENLGWLNKNSIGGFYSNWVGDTYAGEPYVKEWRGYYYWDQYTDLQLKSLSELVKQLCGENNIPLNVVESQGYFVNAINFNGIVCKSNFSDIYNNINPSFNFKFLEDYE
jgi:N-acetyl-anhydromuramyl-L-alanine amidase AmpD